MFDLPPELWVKVFRLTSSSQVGKDPRGYPSLRGKPDTTKLSIIQVSRRFHDLGLQALYETVVLTRDMIRQPDGSHELRLTQRGLRLLDALERNVDRREWVREIYVRGPGRSFEGDIIDYACHDIAKFIQYCARLRTLVLFYHSVLPASLTTILGAICSVPSLELRRLYLNARPHVRDTVAVLQHCRNLNALSITESVDTLSTGEAANVLSLPRLKSLAFGTVELWDLNEVTNDHFRIFTHADMPSLCHLDAEVERVQLASLETFFASISPRITSITASVNTGMRLDTFFEDFISNFPYLREFTIEKNQMAGCKPFRPEGVPFLHLTSIYCRASSTALTNVMTCEGPVIMEFESFRSQRTFRVRSYDTLAGFDNFLAALCGSRFLSMKNFCLGSTPLLRTTEEASKGFEDIKKRTGSDEWWNSWAKILQQEGISIIGD